MGWSWTSRLRVKAGQINPACREILLYVLDEEREKDKCWGLSPTQDGPKWEEVLATEMMPPLCSFSLSDAQELMDDLWRCGLRPTAGKGSAGQLTATERHLSDMRAIASKKIGVDLKD